MGAYNPDDAPFKPDDLSKSRCRFQITNLQNIKFWCTLWGDYSAQFLRFLEVPRQNLVIVLLQLGRINKRFAGDTKGVSSTLHFTKLLLDDHIRDIEEFRERYILFLIEFAIHIYNCIQIRL
ncbi:unnamed protein product [Cuscuta epithymum]|uniref:Uncharacterized protein n=1 Tax=Cuscuta epithymum TaxID=186058 RepID=A0AAV0G1D1_9ASTE|nr:unnamed protein product [Cuscuta epithymum]